MVKRGRGGGIKHVLFKLKDGSLIFSINQPDHNPPHIHVERANGSRAVFLIKSQEVIIQNGFKDSELNEVKKYLKLRKDHILKRWEEIHVEIKNGESS